MPVTVSCRPCMSLFPNQNTLSPAIKDLELASKSKELGQQAGIIEYINKLSSNAAEAEAKMAVRTVSVHADNATSIPDSEGS